MTTPQVHIGVIGAGRIARVHMANLRQKLESSAGQPKFLKTESGIGYRLVDRD